jgi:cytoskeletal protein CcmA (bactofilin family)
VTTKAASGSRVILNQGASFHGSVSVSSTAQITSRGPLSFTSLSIDQGQVVMENDQSLRFSPAISPSSVTRGHLSISGGQSGVLSGVDINISDTDCDIDGSLQGPPNLHVNGDVTLRGNILVDSLNIDGYANLTMDAQLSPKRNINLRNLASVTFNGRTQLYGTPQTTYTIGTQSLGVVTFNDAILGSTIVVSAPVVLSGPSLAMTGRANLTLEVSASLLSNSKLTISGTPILQSGSLNMADGSSIYLNSSDTLLTLADTVVIMNGSSSIIASSPTSQLSLACSDLIMSSSATLGTTQIIVGLSKNICTKSHLSGTGSGSTSIALRPSTTVNISNTADFHILTAQLIAPSLTLFGGGRVTFPSTMTTVTGHLYVRNDVTSSDTGEVFIPSGAGLRSGTNSNITFNDAISVIVEGQLFGGDSTQGSALTFRDKSKLTLRHSGHLAGTTFMTGTSSILQTLATSASMAGQVQGTGKQLFTIAGTLLVDERLELNGIDVDVGVASLVYVRGSGVLVLSGVTTLMLESNANLRCDADAKVQLTDKAKIGADGMGQGQTPYPDCAGLELVSPDSQLTVATVMRVFRDSQLTGAGTLTVPLGGNLIVGQNVKMRVNIPTVAITGIASVESQGKLATLCSQVYVLTKGMLNGNVDIGDDITKCNGVLRLSGSLQGTIRILDGSSINVVGASSHMGPASITCFSSGVLQVSKGVTIDADTDIYCPAIPLANGILSMPTGKTIALTFHKSIVNVSLLCRPSDWLFSF